MKAIRGSIIILLLALGVSFGVTSALLSPGSANVVGGECAVVKTAGSTVRKMVVRRDVGVVVELLRGRESVPPGYMIEFMTLTGETVAVIDVAADAVRPVGERDMPQARALARG